MLGILTLIVIAISVCIAKRLIATDGQSTKGYDNIALVPEVGVILTDLKSEGKVYLHTEVYHIKRYVIYGRTNKNNVMNVINNEGFTILKDYFYQKANLRYAKFFKKPEKDFIFPINNSLIAKKKDKSSEIYLFFNSKNNTFLVDILGSPTSK